MRRRQRARGLTLIEAMVAIGIIAVLVSLALPSFGHIVARQRLKAAAENLAMDLAELGLQATQRGATLHLSFAPGPDWCYALSPQGGCGCRVAQACQLKTVRAADHPGVRLIEAQDARFEPAPGGAVAGGGALLQGADGQRLRVALTPLGRPKVCAPDGAQPSYAAC